MLDATIASQTFAEYKGKLMAVDADATYDHMILHPEISSVV